MKKIIWQESYPEIRPLAVATEAILLFIVGGSFAVSLGLLFGA